jgi:hypothetical protein
MVVIGTCVAKEKKGRETVQRYGNFSVREGYYDGIDKNPKEAQQKREKGRWLRAASVNEEKKSFFLAAQDYLGG